MSKIIEKRSELLFCYDVTDANPNGDPLDENKPRIDEETGINFVTDVRLKRTIRDYLFEYKGYNGTDGKDIFIRESTTVDGFVKDVKQRVRDFVKYDYVLSNDEKEVVRKYLQNEDLSKKDAKLLQHVVEKSILEENIDARLFGSTYPVEFSIMEKKRKTAYKSSITHTGPVQFKMGRSLHKVEMKEVGHSFTMASAEERQRGSLAPEYLVYYSFIAFHGIINQNAAKHTQMTIDDEKLLLEALWNGTKNLITRTKFGQQPRLLVKITYKSPNFFIGDLDRKVKMVTENELKVRGLQDFQLDISELVTAIRQHAEHIESIQYKADPELNAEFPEDWKTLSIE
jgi:CRISPR-associated protein Csh2